MRDVLLCRYAINVDERDRVCDDVLFRSRFEAHQLARAAQRIEQFIEKVRDRRVALLPMKGKDEHECDAWIDVLKEIRFRLVLK